MDKKHSLLCPLLFVSALNLGVTTIPNIVFANDPALQGMVTSGQENGSETDSKHITNGLSGATVASGNSYLGVGYSAGNLVLNAVPNFDFGFNPALKQTDFSMSADGIPLGTIGDRTTGKAGQLPRSLVLSDLRMLTDPTWSVSLQMLNFTDTSNNTDVPANQVTLTSNRRNQTISHGAYDPNVNKFQLDTDTSQVDPNDPSRLDTVVSNGGPAENIFQYLGTDGLSGSWALNFLSKNSMSLHVPLSLQFPGKTYVGTLLWTLGAGPGQSTLPKPTITHASSITYSLAPGQKLALPAVLNTYKITAKNIDGKDITSKITARFLGKLITYSQGYVVPETTPAGYYPITLIISASNGQVVLLCKFQYAL